LTIFIFVWGKSGAASVAPDFLYHTNRLKQHLKLPEAIVFCMMFTHCLFTEEALQHHPSKFRRFRSGLWQKVSTAILVSL
jgi:hypothetical protein